MNSIVDNILLNAKKAYKESVIIENIELQELILSILTDISRIKETSKTNRRHMPRERIILDDEHAEDTNVLAYVFSEYEHTSLFPDKSQTEAFQFIADLLNVKYKTFSNKRDAFDKYTSSKRVGWDKELPPSLELIFKKYKSMSREKVLTVANKKIHKYS